MYSHHHLILKDNKLAGRFKGNRRKKENKKMMEKNGLDAARVTAKDKASSPIRDDEHPCAPAHQFAGVDRVPKPLAAVSNGDPISWQFSCCLFPSQWSKRSKMSVPEWLEPMSTLSSEPQWSLWLLLTFLHFVEALCKVLPLL